MKELFGTLESGEKIYKYVISDRDSVAELIDYGAVMLSLKLKGHEIVLGFDTLEPYIKNPGNIGITVGRVANRIKDGLLPIDNVVYELTRNQHGNCLHGGSGFGHKVWTVTSHEEDRITFRYVSPDGEDGFPSRLESYVTFILEDGALMIDYKAIPDGKTPICLTNHAYFNLNGIGGDVKGHVLKVWADKYTEVDASLIPTGEQPSVEGTRFDLREGKLIGDGLEEGNYDHNLILSPTVFEEFLGKRLGLACELSTEGLLLSVYTDQPGLQIYTGNGMGKGPALRGGIPEVKYGAVCLETQTEPNSATRGEAIYGKGETYTHTAVYKLEERSI